MIELITLSQCFAEESKPVEDEEVKPLKISWSRVLDFEKCKRRSYLAREGVRAKTQDGRNFLPGTLADRCVRLWLQQDEDHAPKQMHSYLEQIWEEYAEKPEEYKIKWRLDPKTDKKFVWDTVIEACDKIEKFLFNAVLPYEYEPDAYFKVPMKIPGLLGEPRDIVLHGYVDIAVYKKNNMRPWWLYDLKVTRNNTYASGPTLGQLIFYPWAWSVRHDVPITDIGSAFLVPLARDQYVPVMPEQKDVDALKASVINYAHAVWRDDPADRVLTSDTAECYNCPTKSACPRFVPPEVPATKGRRVSFADAVQIRINNGEVPTS